MKPQLTEEQLAYINQVIKKNLQEDHCSVFLFGSRATGKAHQFSDVDLLIKCDDRDIEKIRKKLSQIKEFLEDGNFELKVDLVLDQELAHEYREQIYKEMIKL